VVTHSCALTAFLAALEHDFPFPSLKLANYVGFHREHAFLHGKICLFRSDNFTMWVGEQYHRNLVTAMVQKARAVTENSNAPCVVRQEMAIDVGAAYTLLMTCGITRVKVMQYGQKTDFDNKVVKWALENVRAIECVYVYIVVK